jgi:hypothetical protein
VGLRWTPRRSRSERTVRPSRICAADVRTGRCTASWAFRASCATCGGFDGTTGALEGIEMRFLAAELRPARSVVMRRCAAQRVRAMAALWRRAVDDDDEDVDTLACLVGVSATSPTCLEVSVVAGNVTGVGQADRAGLRSRQGEW